MMRSMLASVLFGAVLVTLVTAEDRPPLKFPQEQAGRVRRLVGAVQTEAILLQARLDERQRELAELYTQYELDDQRAEAARRDCRIAASPAGQPPSHAGRPVRHRGQGAIHHFTTTAPLPGRTDRSGCTETGAEP